MIDRQAPAQRSGVLASLNMVADTLKLLPTAHETTQRWSATAWSHDGPTAGCSSQHAGNAHAARPAHQSLAGHARAAADESGAAPAASDLVRPRRAREPAAAPAAPHRHDREPESNNPVVLGFQGRSQLETRYGHDAEAMLSQPATKIFLRTSEPHAAKWISDTLGDVEIERLRESRSSGAQRPTELWAGAPVEPLVMPSEISGLASLRGYLKLGNLVVRLNFPFIDLPRRAPAFVERASSDAVGTTDRRSATRTAAAGASDRSA